MQAFLDLIRGPWHWAVTGLIIGLTVPVLLLLGNKTFGISATLRHICAATVPAKVPFFQYNWRKEAWNLFFVGGIVLGGLIASTLLRDPNGFQLSESMKTTMTGLGITDFSDIMPADVFGFAQLFTLRGFTMMVLGGFLVGFGTRYAGGCTSGHSIMGLSNLQWPSLVATICFMIGGFFSANVLVPFILRHF